MQKWNGSDEYCWRYRADTILSTDGQTDKRKPVYPPFNFVEAGGIKTAVTLWWENLKKKIHQQSGGSGLPHQLISSWIKWMPFWQTTFSNTFSWIKSFVFLFEFHLNLFSGVQFTISQQAPSHYLNQWWSLGYWRIYASLGLSESNQHTHQSLPYLIIYKVSFAEVLHDLFILQQVLLRQMLSSGIQWQILISYSQMTHFTVKYTLLTQHKTAITPFH